MTSLLSSPSYSLRIPTEDLCPESPFLKEPPAPPRNTPQYRPPRPVARPRKNGKQEMRRKKQKRKENVERTKKSSSTRCSNLLPIEEEEDEEETVLDSDTPGDKKNRSTRASFPQPKRPGEDEASPHAKRKKGKHVEIERIGVEAERLGTFNTKIEADLAAEETECRTLEEMMESLKISKEKRMERSDTYVKKPVKMRRSALEKTARN